MFSFKKKNKEKTKPDSSTTSSTTTTTTESVVTVNRNYNYNSSISVTEQVKIKGTTTKEKFRSFSLYSSDNTRDPLNNNFATDALINKPLYRSVYTSEPLTTRKDAALLKPPENFNTSSSSSWNQLSRNTPAYRSLQPSQFTFPSTLPTLTTSSSNNNVPNILPAKGNNKKIGNKYKNKKIVVKKTGKRYDNNREAIIPVYQTSSKKRGEMLVINNIMFKKNEDRFGAEVDGNNIEELFKQLGFSVTNKRNLKAEDMEKEIKKFSSNSRALSKVDISVVVVMSHGTNRGSLSADTQVIGTDEIGLNTDKILQYFTSEKCPQMMNKPKIFIFQCCRGNNENFIGTDATVIKPNLFADVLIAHSTIPGFVSHRDPAKGTWYIQTICDVFSEHAHEYHVEEMLKIVDEKLSEFSPSTKQTSSYESRGFKRCYFHPV